MHCVERCPPSACTRMPKPIHSLDLLLRVVLLRMRPEFHRTSCTQHVRFHAAVRKRAGARVRARGNSCVCVKDRRPDGQKVCVCVCVCVFERQRERERMCCVCACVHAGRWSRQKECHVQNNAFAPSADRQVCQTCR